MSESEQPATNVIQALARVIRDLPGIAKGERMQSNSGSYNFRGIEAVTRELAPLLAKHGVVFVPSGVVRWERDEITLGGKPWTDDRIVEHYRIYGPGGVLDYIDAEVPGIGRDNSDKGSNKAMSGAFKYLLLQTLCISDSKDDPDNEKHETDQRGRPKQQAAPPQAQRGRQADAAQSNDAFESAAPARPPAQQPARPVNPDPPSGGLPPPPEFNLEIYEVLDGFTPSMVANFRAWAIEQKINLRKAPLTDDELIKVTVYLQTLVEASEVPVAHPPGQEPF